MVVVATIRSTGGTRNIARDGRDRTKPATNYIVQSQDFVATVEKVFKGAPTGDITVALAKARGPAGLPLAAAIDYIPFQIGTKYVLFLVRIPGEDAYGQTPEPFRFEVSTTVRPVAAIPAVAQRFQPLPQQQFMDELRAATSGN